MNLSFQIVDISVFLKKLTIIHIKYLVPRAYVMQFPYKIIMEQDPETMEQSLNRAGLSHSVDVHRWIHTLHRMITRK